MRVLVTVVVLLICVIFAAADIIELDTSLDSGTMITYKQGMYGTNEVPSAPFLQGGARVQVHFMAQLEEDGHNSTVWALIYPHSVRKSVGITVEGKYHFCCTDEISEFAQCETGAPIVTSRLVFKRSRNLGSSPVDLALTVGSPLLMTDLYHVAIVTCKKYSGQMKVTGDITFKSPFGYLPGSEFGLFPFYGMLGVQYVILLLWWLTLCIYHRKLLILQLAITGMVVVTLIEMVIGFMTYFYWNTLGHVPYIGVFLRILMAIVKKSSARVLIVIVSLGYGVVRKKLSRNTWIGLSVLGLFYFIAAAFLEAITDVGVDMFVFGPLVEFLAILPVSLLDSIFYWFVLLSVNDVIGKLRKRQRGEKYSMYKKWVTVLVVALLCALMILLFQMVVFWKFTPEEMWQINWSFDACWHVFFFLILVAIMVIWRPTSDNTRLAYSDDLNIDDSDDEEFAPVTPEVLRSESTRRRRTGYDIETGDTSEEYENEDFGSQDEEEDHEPLLPKTGESLADEARRTKISETLQKTKVKDLPKKLATGVKKGIQATLKPDDDDDFPEEESRAFEVSKQD